MGLMARSIASLAVLCAGHAAWAQHDHHHHQEHSSEQHAGTQPPLNLHIGLSAEMGRVEAFASDVDYQGVALMVGATRGDFEFAGHAPFYRIDLGGARVGSGVGDIHVEGRWMGLRRDGVQAGFALGVMPPFGDDDDGLGMGHWMIMTGALARWTGGRLSLAGRFGYNGALNGEGHAEHGVPAWPPVSPMNAHELALSGNATLAVARRVAVSVQLASAAPLGEGEFLALAGGGASYDLGRVQLGLGVRHGFVGHTAGLVASGHAMATF